MRPLIDVKLPAQPTAASEARQRLSVLANDIPEETYEDIRILVTELVSNSVRHSGISGDEAVTVGVWNDQSCLRVEVGDSGKGFDKVVKPFTSDQCGGWGLQIVDRLSDRWGVQRANGRGSTVWFEIDLRRD